MNIKYVPPFEQVMERLRIALEIDSYGGVADCLGIKRNAFYNRKSSGSLPYEHIISVCSERDISLDWIFRGQGQPYLDAKEWVAPVAEIDPALLAEIHGELALAFDGEQEREALMAASSRGGLAAQIFNKVAFVKSETLRTDMIREQATLLAQAAKWFR